MSTFLYGGNVHANGIRQHYLRYGKPNDAAQQQRDAIILVPGITSPAVTWGFVAERLGQYFDTYVLDVRGRGLSSAEDGLDYGLTAQAHDVIEFAKAIGLTRYAVVGHSMGGRIGARAAAMHPEGLTRLVMVDPPVSGPGRRPYPAQLPWYVDSMALARKGCTAEQMRAFCPTWTEEQLQLRAQWLHTCNESAIIQSFNDFQNDDVHQDFAKVTVPTLLMIAERGDVIRPEEAEEIQSLIPKLSISHVADAGHMIPWDNEEGFYQAFGEFLGAALNP
ncbi:MAG TPA: alpha/beta hydrolase [Paenalcaligenes hominis]|uniref:Alpha/beta hydrolase n=1 Tax=Paenalcaligenes hominis TaxID=643674 RepID=A0A1U9K135_9BURK|nr:alpha/beta hydrolase [Paenalcaligenes hominis]AQS51773.1 alpha/beta hydrolase [Paenalcaligenes hominis]NJB65058.1 N-formylmaleamate deformylase [Paenalcaligenes hominis]GGE56983.1 alpha/beta hydrolase [Paenalcaligenes hominis]HJH23420.1 alpha/beta hydrolase [Paenalcaligenes hominis]